MADGPAPRWLPLIAGLQLLNTLLLVGVLARLGPHVAQSEEPGIQVRSPARTAATPARTPSGEPPPPRAGAGPALDALFASLVDPLAAAVNDLGGDPATDLPSQAAIDAAVASGSLDSPASQAVLAQLREAYAAHNMPFPELGP